MNSIMLKILLFCWWISHQLLKNYFKNIYSLWSCNFLWWKWIPDVFSFYFHLSLAFIASGSCNKHLNPSKTCGCHGQWQTFLKVGFFCALRFLVRFLSSILTAAAHSASGSCCIRSYECILFLTSQIPKQMSREEEPSWLWEESDLESNLEVWSHLLDWQFY